MPSIRRWTFSTGLGSTILSGGTLQVLNGGSFSTTSLNLSGGATLQVAASGAFTSSGANSLGSDGGTISNDADISLANISNSIPGTPLTKSGGGILTLSGIGTQITGPVDLDITAGSVVANGPVGSARQINIIGTNVFDGDLTLNGPVLMLHGSTVSGTGSIIMSNATSSITSRLNAGAVDVGVPVTLTADANVESPNGGNILYLNTPITGGFGLVKKGNGIVVFAATNSHTTTTIEAGTLRVGTGTGGTLGTGDVTIASTGILSFNRDDVTAVPNTISGLGRVTMAGGNAASVELTGLNIYTGLTTVTSGTLNAPVLSNGDQPGSIGAASSDAANIVLNGGTLAHTGPATTCDRGFTLGIAGGTIAANGTGALTLDYTGGVGLVEPTPATVGNLTVGNNYQIVDPGDTNFIEIGAANNNPGTTFTATGPGTGTGTVVFANTRPLRLAGTAPGIHELAATIADASNAPTSLTKNGTNTWSITATNTYTGTTRINAGILRIDGDNSAATGSITVAATGSLGGNGSSGGQVILESGGGLAVRITDWTGAPGTGYHDLAVASLDAASVPMTVTIDASGLANFTDSGKSFTILNTSGGITNFNTANVTVTAPGFPGTGYWTLTQSGNALVLTYALGGNLLHLGECKRDQRRTRNRRLRQGRPHQFRGIRARTQPHSVQRATRHFRRRHTQFHQRHRGPGQWRRHLRDRTIHHARGVDGRRSKRTRLPHDFAHPSRRSATTIRTPQDHPDSLIPHPDKTVGAPLTHEKPQQIRPYPQRLHTGGTAGGHPHHRGACGAVVHGSVHVHQKSRGRERLVHPAADLGRHQHVCLGSQ